MAVQLKTELTPLQQFEQLPEGPPYFELIHNQVFEMPSPSSNHQSVSTQLIIQIGMYLLFAPIGKLIHAPIDIELDQQNILEPDLLFVANEKLNIIGKNRIYGAPDWVCEILSPSTRKRDLNEKRELYFRFGVKEYWIVDPENQSIEVLANREKDFESIGIFTGDQPVISNVFQGINITARQIF